MKLGGLENTKCNIQLSKNGRPSTQRPVWSRARDGVPRRGDILIDTTSRSECRDMGQGRITQG